MVFNESFASFVGGRGAIAFFRASGDSALARRAEREWEDDKRLGAFWAALYATLDSTFAAHPDSLDPAGAKGARLAARDSIYAAARTRLVDSVAPLLHTWPRAWAERVPLDNAVLMARRVYATGLDGFDAGFAREGGALAATVRAIVTRAKAGARDPFAAVAAWADSLPPTPVTPPATPTP